MPGPGTYKRKSEFEKGKPMSFGKMERDNPMLVKEQLKNPGAGTYKVKSAVMVDQTKGRTIAPKRPMTEQSER